MKQKIALISVVVNIFLFVSKVIVGLLSNSASILAEGIDSGTDIISSTISSIGIRISEKPVDEKHPYGHYKFEVFSGLLITIILFLTGVGVVYSAYKEFFLFTEVKVGYLSLGVMLFSAVVNEIMARLKINYGKKEGLVSLISDGVHSRIDVWRSIAVFVGLILTKYWVHADQIIALLVGLYIIRESFRIGREATDSLLDVSADKEQEEEIKKIVRENNVELVNLKTQKKGSVITANLIISLSGDINVQKATEITNKLKQELINKIKKLEYIAIQIDSDDADILDSYFEPRETIFQRFNKGFGWQRKGKFQKVIEDAEGKGPDGFCTCSKCGHTEKHQTSAPCSTSKCPRCGSFLKRE